MRVNTANENILCSWVYSGYGMDMSSVIIGPMRDGTTHIDVPVSHAVSAEDFVELCRRNPEQHIEQDANGDITIMAPSGGETGRKNARITATLVNWADNHGGVVLDSSAGFRLPNGATRAPDAAWISQEQWDSVPIVEREGFPPLVPEFVVEIVSPSDSLTRQIEKMEEYTANGVSLGWLIIPDRREVRIFREIGATPETVTDAPNLGADEKVLPEFVLDLSRIW